MSRGPTHSWDAAAAEEKQKLLRAALERTGGSITEAAHEMKLTRQQVTNLVRQFKLKEFAAELRVKHGGVKVRAGERKGIVLGRARKPTIVIVKNNDK